MRLSLNCVCSFIKIVGPESEYHQEAIDRFNQLCAGRKLVANTDFKEGSLRHLRLMDTEQHLDPLSSINVDLVREGLATIDRKGCRYLHSYPQVLKKLQEAVIAPVRTIHVSLFTQVH